MTGFRSNVRAMHVLVWEFRVRAGCEAEFEAAYGSAGPWVALFAGADGYLGTELLRDRAAPDRYLTIDRWRDPAAYDRFRAERAGEYAALDQRCAAWTEAEAALGALEVVP
ncbi:MAG TPA: antibiotic biosynthesis monooxygenase family protein [Kofleriaceae bacterium]|nr:antibiotic biosynthesis monooxygenase family protein [Kofleriaceae bacterium]